MIICSVGCLADKQGEKLGTLDSGHDHVDQRDVELVLVDHPEGFVPPLMLASPYGPRRSMMRAQRAGKPFASSSTISTRAGRLLCVSGRHLPGPDAFFPPNLSWLPPLLVQLAENLPMGSRIQNVVPSPSLDSKVNEP